MLQTLLNRRSLLIGGGAVAGSVALGSVGSSAASAGGSSALTPSAALTQLMAGNKRFVANKVKHTHQGRKQMNAVAKGQHPFAIILGCADSRVSPEVLFDRGIGDLFVNRVAGNLVDDLLLGSMEYAVEEFEPPVIMVLGHARCGAVTATQGCVRTGDKAAGHIQSIVEALTPIVGPYAAANDSIEKGVRANVKAQVAAVLAQSDIIREKVEKGRTKVVGARYGLDAGKVTLVA